MYFQYSQSPYFSTLESQFSGEASEILTEVSNKKNVARSADFSIEEDRLIVSAWLNTSLDAVHENEQKCGTFWEQMEEYYHKTRNLVVFDLQKCCRNDGKENKPNWANQNSRLTILELC